jgi:hypothetical protein
MVMMILALQSSRGPSTHVRRSALMTAARCISFAAVAAFWALQLSQQLESASAWLRLGLPRLVYALAFIQLFHVWRQPAQALPQRRGRADAGASSRQINRRETSPKRISNTNVAGLAQEPSSRALIGSRALKSPHRLAQEPSSLEELDPLSPIVECLIPSAALIFGADSAPVLAAAVALLRLVGFVTKGHPLGPLLAEFLTCQVATGLFYGTGHRPTFEGIQYGAAFVGIDDVSVNDVAHVCAFVLTVLNTMGSWVLTALASISAARPPVSLRDGVGDGRGAMLQLVYAVSLAMTSLFVALERRHLMVWAIFAPKLVYDMATALVSNCVVLARLVAKAGH